MTLHELIDALTVIAREHGPEIPVCHNDDWAFFVVDRVTFVPADATDGFEPAHVEIEGCVTRASQLPGGAEYTAPGAQDVHEPA